MPSINRDGVTGLAIVVRHHGRKLFQRYVSREALPLVVKPGLREKRIVVARAHRVIPLPCGQFAALWLPVHKHLRHAFRVSLRLLEHRELIGVHRLILMDGRLDVPTCKVPAIAARERARSQPSHRNALPVAVINVARRPRLARVLEWQTQRPLPGGFRNSRLPPGFAISCRANRCRKEQHHHRFVFAELHQRSVQDAPR